MKRLFWIALAGVMAASAPSLGKPEKDAERRIQGVWRLAAYKSSLKSPQPWVGLMFLERGYFSRMYQQENREKLSFNYERETDLTPEQKDQLIESFREFRAGIGTYRIAGNTIVMKSMAIYNPNALGGEFTREFRFVDDKLILTGTTKVAGDQVEEVWTPAD